MRFFLILHLNHGEIKDKKQCFEISLRKSSVSGVWQTCCKVPLRFWLHFMEAYNLADGYMYLLCGCGKSMYIIYMYLKLMQQLTRGCVKKKDGALHFLGTLIYTVCTLNFLTKKKTSNFFSCCRF